MPTRDEALAALTGPGGPFEIVEGDVFGQRLRIYKSAPPSLRAILETTRSFGDLPFLVYGHERITFAEFWRQVAGLAHALRGRYGVGKGDRVAIGMRNYPEWVVAFWACQSIGAITVSLNAWWTADELIYALDDSQPTVLLLDGERLDRLQDHLGGRAAIVTRHDGPVGPGVDRWAEVIGAGADELPEAFIEPDDDATILYTSGTTGSPKGAVGTHRNHVTNITNTLLAGALAIAMAPPVPAPEPGQELPPPAPRMVALWTFPFFHIGGLTGLYLATTIGAEMVTMYRWDPVEALDLIERERVTTIAGVPTVVRSLLEHPQAAERDLTSLGGISQGGSPVPPDLIEKIENNFQAKVAPANGYGLTETTSAIIANSGAAYFAHKDSVGRPVPVTDVMVVGEDGHEVPQGDVGELWVRGPNNVRGYWNKPEATAQSFTDGWFHTGDAARIDEEGFVYVVDRIKDVVLRGGENVYSAEVEAVLYEHPAVLDCAVFGLPHQSLGEEVAAVVNLRPGAHATATELQEHVARRLARFKVPSTVVVRDEPVPRNVTGKLLKRQLRDELKTAR